MSGYELITPSHWFAVVRSHNVSRSHWLALSRLTVLRCWGTGVLGAGLLQYWGTEVVSAEVLESGDLTGEDKALKAMVKAKEEIAQKDKELDQEVGRSTHSTASHSSTHSTATVPTGVHRLCGCNGLDSVTDPSSATTCATVAAVHRATTMAFMVQRHRLKTQHCTTRTPHHI